MNCYKIFFYFFICVFTGLAHSVDPLADIPYQNCNTRNEEFTANLLADESATQAGFCTLCQIKPSPINRIEPLPSFHIPKECFLAMATRGNQKFAIRQYPYCPSKTSGRRGSRKVCVNEDYIDMIHTAFTRMANCFNFDEKKQKEIFHLINQESGGILNVQSGSWARCLGQITKGYAETINAYIHQAKKYKTNLSRYAQIYNEVISRCPDLESKVVSNRIVKREDTSFTCHITRDPYTCLFYTFYGLEANHRRLQANLNSAQDYKEGEFSAEEIKRFKLPIKIKEFLNVRIKRKVDGEWQEDRWIFWDDSELYKSLKSLKDNKVEFKILSVKKTPVFKDEEEIEILFNYWSHNGGSSLSGDRMITMVENLKQSIANPCAKGSSGDECRMDRSMRVEVEKRGSISTQLAMEFFQEDLTKNYPSDSAKRRREVADYAENIINTAESTFDFKEGEDQTNTMVNSYKKSFKFTKRGFVLSDKSALLFQKRVSKICPKIDFIQIEKTEEKG